MNILYTDLEKWKKQAKKLDDYYTDIESLSRDAEKIFLGNVAIIVVSSRKLVSVRPNVLYTGGEDWHTSRDSIFYRLEDDGSLTKVNVKKIIKELADYLSGKVTVKKLMKDVLDKLDPEALLEVYDRAIIKKGKVGEEEGCYALTIGGKKGRPMKIFIVD